MADWKKLCDLSDLPDGRPALKAIGTKKFLVVRHGEGVSVCSNKCPHYGDPMSDGLVRGGEIICPSHYARFKLATGRMTATPALDDLRTFEAKVEGDEVLVGRARPLTFEMTKPDGSDPRTFVIVGGGAAGSAAAENLRREGFDGKIVVITADTRLPYDRPELSKGLLTGETEQDWLPLRGAEFYEGTGIDVRTGVRATALDGGAHTLSLEGGEILSYDRLLIATGGRARRLSFPGSDGSNVHVLRSQDDGEKLLDAVGRSQKAVIIGAGFVGLEVASSLRSRGIKVSVVAPEAIPLAGVYGEHFGKRIQRLHESEGTQFFLGRTAGEIRRGGASSEVVLSDGTVLEADLVLMGVGIELETDWLESSGMVVDGAIPVDRTLATRVPDVFAAGDIAVAPYGPTEVGVRTEHWAVAQRQGRHAALSMLGSTKPYEEIPFFWSIQCDSSIKYVGWTGGEYDAVVHRGDPDGGSFLSGYFKGGRIRAAASLNMSWDIIAIEAILRDGGDLEADQLANADFDLLPLANAMSGKQ